MEFDYCIVLNVHPDASEHDIKKAYQQKLKLYHPDKVKNSKTIQKEYKLIREARDVLKDQQKRKIYDLERVSSHHKSHLDNINEFNNFIKLQTQNVSDDDIRLAKLNFYFDKLKLNHGLDLT